MGRSEKWTIRMILGTDGEPIPLMTIDGDGKVTLLVSEEKRQEYEQKMLKNIGETMSRYYTAHPEKLKGVSS